MLCRFFIPFLGLVLVRSPALRIFSLSPFSAIPPFRSDPGETPFFPPVGGPFVSFSSHDRDPEVASSFAALSSFIRLLIMASSGSFLLRRSLRCWALEQQSFSGSFSCGSPPPFSSDCRSLPPSTELPQVVLFFETSRFAARACDLAGMGVIGVFPFATSVSTSGSRGR